MKVWINGELKEDSEVRIHPLTHSLHYGDAAFEGIRAYEQHDGSVAIFRLKEHAKRLEKSVEALMGKPMVSAEDVVRGSIEAVRANALKDAYVRPIYFLGNGTIGLHNIDKNEQFLAVMAIPFPPYLGKEPIRVMVSSLRKTPSVSLPSTAKISANYVNSILATREAKQNGYDEALLLNIHQRIAEGPGENFFVVRDGEIITPPVSEDILAGITRDAVMKIARDMGYSVREEPLGVADLYTVDEAFFTGTAAEIVAIKQISNIRISEGTGEITAKLQGAFENIVRGKDENYSDWLTPV